MQSTAPRPVTRRNYRTTCPRCNLPMELHRMRSHLRDEHHMESAELESVLLIARRDAYRGPAHGRG